MLSKGIILIIIVIVSLIIVLITTFISIIKRKEKNTRNTCIPIAALAFLFAIGLSIYTSIKVFHVAKKKGGEAAMMFVEALGEHLSARHPNSYFLDSKEYTTLR